MPYALRFTAPSTYLEISYTGTVTRDELFSSANEILAALRQHALSRMLTDCTTLDGGPTAFDLYALSDWFSVNAPRVKEAVLFNDHVLVDPNIQFWETTCHNHCLQVRSVSDRAAALNWLQA